MSKIDSQTELLSERIISSEFFFLKQKGMETNKFRFLIRKIGSAFCVSKEDFISRLEDKPSINPIKDPDSKFLKNNWYVSYEEALLDYSKRVCEQRTENHVKN